MNSQVLDLAKTAFITKWKQNGHGTTWEGDYNGNPVTINFLTQTSELTISTDQSNVLEMSISFNGQTAISNLLVSFNGNFIVYVNLDDLSVQQTMVPDSDPVDWNAYLYLSSGVFTLGAVTIVNATPASDAAAIQAAMTTSLQAALDQFVADSPIFLGTHSGNSEGKVSSAAAQAAEPTLIEFITINTDTDAPLLVALAMVEGETAPTGDWQSNLETAGTFNLPDNANTVFAVADNTLWDLIAQFGPSSTDSDGAFFSYGVSGNDPSVLTIDIKPGDTTSILQAAQDFDWTGVCQLTMPYNQLQINLTIKGAYTASYQFGLAVSVVQNADGTASLQKSFSSEGTVVTFNPSATGPVAVMASISGLILLLQFGAALLEAIAAIIWYSVLYEILEQIPDKITSAINDNINKNPKEIGNANFSLQTVTFDDGIIVGLEVFNLRKSSGTTSTADVLQLGVPA